MTTVLIIDDDHEICRIMSSLINQMGHSAVSKHTLNDGLKEVMSKPYDVVLLDVFLPDGSGLDILPKIRNTQSSPEVIIMTGFGNEDGAETAIKSGAWDYIQKTDSPKKVILPLKRVIQYRNEMVKKQKIPVALNLDGIVGSGPQMKSCFDLLAQAAVSDINVLLTGETGTGKELFAHAIHKNSNRSDQNFVVVDCAALPDTLVESLLFGHKKGAFTGAEGSRDGLVLQAHGGTLFLDEVGELPLSIQKVFLRVLQERRFRPVGSREEIYSNFRLVAATNRDLDQWCKTGCFRNDLLYRIRALTIDLPPLREHPEDIGELAIYYANELCKRHQIVNKGLSPEFLEVLSSYHWPGNVRELIKTLDVAISSAGDSQIMFPKHLPEYIRINTIQNNIRKNSKFDFQENKKSYSLPSFPNFHDNKTCGSPALRPSLKQFRKVAAVQAEKQYLEELMTNIPGNIEAACQISELSRSRLYELIKIHNISI